MSVWFWCGVILGLLYFCTADDYIIGYSGCYEFEWITIELLSVLRNSSIHLEERTNSAFHKYRDFDLISVDKDAIEHVRNTLFQLSEVRYIEPDGQYRNLLAKEGKVPH